MGSLVISKSDPCHTRDVHSTRMAREPQHPSLIALREREAAISKGLNRMLSVKQPVNSHLPGEYVGCRNCNLDVLKNSYRAHLDSEGDTRTVHIYEVCDADLKSSATLQHLIRDHAVHSSAITTVATRHSSANHVKTTSKRSPYLMREREASMSVPLREHTGYLTLNSPVDVVFAWCHAFVNYILRSNIACTDILRVRNHVRCKILLEKSLPADRA